MYWWWEYSSPVAMMIPLSGDGGCFSSQWENHALTNLEADEPPPVSPPPLQLSSYSELRETQTNNITGFNYFKYRQSGASVSSQFIFFQELELVETSTYLRGSERTDRMVLVDYEDYEEVETISSDDIYYDAGQAQLMATSNIKYFQFLFGKTEIFLLVSSILSLLEWTLIVEFYKGRGIDFNFNKNLLQSSIHFYVINLSILK